MATPVEASADEPVPRRAVERVAERLESRVGRPYRARLVRQDARRWSAGARAVRGETIDLPRGLPVASLEVVRAPGEDAEARADGEAIAPAVEPLFADAVRELERRGAERFESFVVRADRVGEGTWQVTVDPL